MHTSLSRKFTDLLQAKLPFWTKRSLKLSKSPAQDMIHITHFVLL